MLKGVDVYQGDGVIDWTRVKAAGHDFALIKASQGTTIDDGKHAANVANARSAGLVVGSYHFFEPTYNGSAQAKFFADCVGDFGGQIIPTIDAEKRGGMTVDEYTKSVQAWLDVIEHVIGRKPMIYVNRDYAVNQLNPSFGEYPLWLAQRKKTPPTGPIAGWSNWTFWQNDAYATVPGLPNVKGVDTDRFSGTLADLNGLIVGGQPQPTTTPVKVVNHETGELIETLNMVPNGNHIADDRKLYVRP